MFVRSEFGAALRGGLMLVLLASASRSWAHVYLGAFWPDGTVTLQLQLHTGSPSGPGRLADGASSWNQVAQEAVQVWNGHISTTRFAAVNNASTSREAGNGQNDIYWASSVGGYTLDEYTLGLTLIDDGEDSGVAREADIVLNTNAHDGWDSYRGARRVSGPNDLRRVILHELGHVLGLDHPDEQGQVVAAQMNSTISDIDGLTNDDIRGATYVYGPRLPPVITSQPADAVIEPPAPFEFSVEVSGRGPLSYQWLRNGVRFVEGNRTGGFPALGSTTIRYNESSSAGVHAGDYRVIVSNPFGSVASDAASLKLTRGITGFSGDQTVIEGEAATFSVTVAGGAPVTYEWRRSVEGHYDQLIPGATGPTLTVPAVSFADVGSYSVRVSSQGVDLGGAVARLDVKLGFRQAPLSRGVKTGDSVVLDAAVIGAPGLSYPRGIVANPDGSFLVGGSSIRRVSADGELSLVVKTFGGQVLARRSDGVLFFTAIAGKTIDHLVGNVAVPFAGIPDWGARTGLGDQVSFGEIVGLAFDPEGTLYVADRMRGVLIAISPDGMVREVAGDGAARNSWDPPQLPVDGMKTAARFGSLQAVATDGEGNVYVVDQGTDFAVIRKVTPDGAVTTVAGSVGAKQQVMDGAGSAAAFWTVRAITSTAAGELFVIDHGTIRKITPEGVVTTLAGSANEFGHADATGAAARFSREASGLAIGADGALYVEDAFNHVVRRVSGEGLVTTFAGRPGEESDFDGTSLRYQWLRNGEPIEGATELALTLDDIQTAEIGDYQLRVSNSVGVVTSPVARVDWNPVIVRQPQNVAAMPGEEVRLEVEAVSPSGRPLTYQWKRWDGSIPSATDSVFIIPRFGPELGSFYSVVVSDGQFSVESEPAIVNVAMIILRHPAAGSQWPGTPLVLSVEALSGAEALFSAPKGAVEDGDGNVYIADDGNHVIRKIGTDGRVTTLAGKPGELGATDGVGRAARFGWMTAITIAAEGALYVSEVSGTIRRVTAAGEVTTIAGKSETYGSTDGIGAAARFSSPSGLAVSPAGDIYLCDTGNHTIRRITVDGVVSTLCGKAGEAGAIDGDPLSARFSYPRAMTMNPEGDLLVTDNQNLIRRVTLDGRVSTFLGHKPGAEITNGPSEQVGFGQLQGIVADRDGNVFVIDQGLVRQIARDGFVSFVTQYSIDPLQSVGGPAALWVSGSGDLIVADAGSHVIRSISRKVVSILAGVRGSNGYRDGELTRYEWFLNDTPIAGDHGNVLQVTENFQAGQAGRYSVRVANHAAALFSQEAEIGSIVARPAVREFRSHTRTIEVGGSVEFVLRASGSEPLTYQWFKDGDVITGETGSTLKIVSAKPSDGGSYSATVTNPSGSAQTGSALLNIWATGLPTLSLHPPVQANVEEGYPLSLTAEASQSENVSYQWFRNGVEIPGATSAHFTRKAEIGDEGTYVVRVANEAGGIFSHPTTVGVRPLQLPTFPKPAESFQVREGAPVVIYASVENGRDEMTYQWSKDGQPIPGATERDLRLVAVSREDAGVYSVTVTIGAGSVTSERATVAVTEAAGLYFGEFSDGGRWALRVQPDRTGMFFGYLASRQSVVITNVTLDASWNFYASVVEHVGAGASSGAKALSVDSEDQGSSTGDVLTFIVSVGEKVEGRVLGADVDVSGAKEALPEGSVERYFRGSVRDGHAGEIHVLTSPSGKTFVAAVTQEWVGAAFVQLPENGRLVTDMIGGGEVSLAIDEAAGTLSGGLLLPNGGGVTQFAGLGASAVSTTRLVAISTRSRAGTADQTLIMGFVVVGDGEKDLVVRGVGPTLAALGVSEALQDPEVLLYRGDGSLLERNNDWGGGSRMLQTFSRLGMSPVLAADSKDAALVKEIAPGLYTAHVTAAAGGTGIALVEVYDGDTESTSRFSALSTRTVAGYGENTLTAGIVLAGEKPKRLLIRGVGPSLVRQGVSPHSVLPDPQVALFSSNSVIARNDNWGGTEELKIAFKTAGLADFESAFSKDAALSVTLEPGVYTVHVSGVGNTSGVALIEVYEMP